jgi:AAA+ superfamily predicted ATPase
MHTLYERKPPVLTLYVKTAPSSYDIGSIFRFARSMTPCMLVLEDIDTIVTERIRSYFFNEVDGLENNDGEGALSTFKRA